MRGMQYTEGDGGFETRPPVLDPLGRARGGDRGLACGVHSVASRAGLGHPYTLPWGS
jgi:hypothetical protein